MYIFVIHYILHTLTPHWRIYIPCESEYIGPSGTMRCSPIHSTSLEMIRNERGLIGDRYIVDKRAAAYRCGNRLVGALKICEVVLHFYKYYYVV